MDSRLPALRTRDAAHADIMGVAMLHARCSRTSSGCPWLLLVYVYVGYPIVAVGRARLWPKPRVRAADRADRLNHRHRSQRGGAHRRAHREPARARLSAAQARDRDRLGRIDGRHRRARAASTRNMASPCARSSSIAASPPLINALVPIVRGEIVMFADARQRFEPRDRPRARGELRGSARRRAPAASWCSPPPTAPPPPARAPRSTGATRSSSGPWKGVVDSTIGATGAIYAIRRALFEPIPDDTLLDDVLIPLRIVRRGYRDRLRADARAHDCASSTARQEFVRKTRTIAGNVSADRARGMAAQSAAQPPLVRNGLAQGAARWRCRCSTPSLLASNVMLADSGFYGLMLGAAGDLLRRGGRSD